MNWLFQTTGLFVPRIMCGRGFTLPVVYAFLAGDLAIFYSYIAIPRTLIAAHRKLCGRYPDSVRSLIPWFAAFIILCGLTHFCGALAFYWPAYRLFALVTILTAVVSTVTVFKLRAVARWSMQSADQLLAGYESMRDELEQLRKDVDASGVRPRPRA